MLSSTVIIPVFNNAALTAQCLELALDSGHTELIVVDDGSTDQTRQVLRRFHRRLKVISHKENRGFAVSCNDGAKAAQGKHMVFLNNDTLPSPGWLNALESYAATHPNAAVIG